MENMTLDEMRSCRREWINAYLQAGYSLAHIKHAVRLQETRNYGAELRRYA